MAHYYKAFDRELKCRGFQYVEGQTYWIEGDPILCEKGFHFCKDLVLTLQYYPVKDVTDNRYAVVEPLGTIILEQPTEHKGVAAGLKIIRVLTDEEVVALLDQRNNSGKNNSGNNNSGNNNSGGSNSGNNNSGKNNSGNNNSGGSNSGDNNSGGSNSGGSNSGGRNSGYSNSGNRNSGDNNSGDNNSGDYNSGDNNSGDYNSGDYNSGDYNSGDYNSGDYNSGDYNSGDRNSGDNNSGDVNSGDRNSGDRNSGQWNACAYETGSFNTVQSDVIRVFNMPCNRADWENAKKPRFLYFSIGSDYKKSFQESFKSATDEDIEMLRNLPNFDADVFFEISGIRV